ncbi:MAG: hypothetical protein ACQEQS_06720 [Thermodesulfobacteriota bacterium]
MENKILKFLENEKVITISVIQNNLPWIAPVYYVYDKKFYFFSSPDSIHILYGVGKEAACSVFSDASETGGIKGVQMRGKIEKSGRSESVSAFLKYIKKFSSYIPENNLTVSGFEKAFKSKMYSFIPEYIVYTDNSDGFGSKTVIDPDKL